MNRLWGGIFLLLVTASIRSALCDIHVHLKPVSAIKLCEGATFQINCTYGPGEKYKVSWHFNAQTDNDECNSPRINTENSLFIQNNNDTWSTLTNPFIRTNESGWYFCKVIRDIPYLQVNCSTGLHVLVEENNTSTPGPNQTQTTTNSPTTCSYTVETTTPPNTPPNSVVINWWIWVTLAVGSVVLIVLIVGKCMLSCRTKEIIYENTETKKSGCCRRDRTPMDSSNLPASKKMETIKPLRKYDTVPQNRNHRP